MNSLQPVRGDAGGITALLREWDAADAEPEPLVIETSGSTGRPKRVLLSRRALRASADATHARLGGPGQWVLNLPPTYVAGVQVLFRSLRAGVEPVVTDRLAPLRGRLAAPTYVALVPTQLVRILREQGDRTELRALAEVGAVLIGGGPLAADVRAQAEDFGLRIVQTYGMSETCGGCVYDGVPLDGVEMRTKDGEVQLRGPMLFDGYEGEPERTASALDDGWFRTHDLGAVADGRLRVDGRNDDVILSGGVNVAGSAVAKMIVTGSGLYDVEVLGVPDEEWGERVVAVIAATDPVSLDNVRDLVEPRAWAPRQLLVLQEIPRLPNGKPDRQTMKRMALDA